MKKIAIYTEIENSKINETAYELISKAYELKHIAKNMNNTDIEITSVGIAPMCEEASIRKAFSAGADRFVLIKNDDFFEFNQMKYTSAFLNYFNKDSHDYILFPATPRGRIIAPRITTILNTGLVADCTGLEFILSDNNIKLAATRPTFGAELMATILSKQTPECATIRPKTFKANFANDKIGKYVEFHCSVKNLFNLKLVDVYSENTVLHSFDNSKVIFAAGFGLYDGKDNEYVKKLYELTKKLKIDFALSRKLVDLNVMSAEFQVGQTGATVSPDLYVAFGISGAIQHVSGMKNSKIIAAINNDENADIFKYADYKIVADAKTIIDEMIDIVG